VSLRFSESGESLLVSSESLLVSHLRINDNRYLLILLSRLSASTQASLDHQLHNSLEAVEPLFWCHRFFPSGEVKYESMIARTFDVSQE
jgi:hypothetical protein